tara:strand:+ start:165 stop:359 length:195 start_codon:yes stop_codon:yes gene_type:complete
MIEAIYYEGELPLDHEPSLNHWAKALADDDIATGYHTNWDAAYEAAWDFIEDETLYHDEYRSIH